jgi:hypothetical protein
MMQWEGKPSVKRMVAVLEKHLGEELRALGDIDVERARCRWFNSAAFILGELACLPAARVLHWEESA